MVLVFGLEWRVHSPTQIRRQDLGARLRALATGIRSGADKSTRREHGVIIFLTAPSPRGVVFKATVLTSGWSANGLIQQDVPIPRRLVVKLYWPVSTAAGKPSSDCFDYPSATDGCLKG